MRSSILCRVCLFLENGSILMIWGCFSIVSNVIRSNYYCRRHTMHENMVFSRDYIFSTPQQCGCLLACNVNGIKSLRTHTLSSHTISCSCPVSGHFVPMRSRPIPFRTQGHKLPYHFVPKSYHFVPKVIPFRTQHFVILS